MSDSSSSLAIEVTSLSKVYQRGKKSPAVAVQPLDLAIAPGQIFGFLGSNGAGKTTTIKMICGLVLPTTGKIRVNGYDIQRERSSAMRQIGAVLEGTRNVYWRLSAWQNLLYFGHLKGKYGKKLRTHAEELLRELELWERRDDDVRLFSRGMQQKVAIACALIGEPSVVLLDEPTLGLDVQASRTVKTWIQRLTREQGKTVILTTHQLDIAQDLCDQVAIMSKGALLANKPLPELLGLFDHEYYQIRVQGQLSSAQQSAFADFQIVEEEGETVLSGAIAGQAALHAHLADLAQMRLPLLSVARVEPNLEEVFVRLIGTQNQPQGGEEESYAHHTLSHV